MDRRKRSRGARYMRGTVVFVRRHRRKLVIVLAVLMLPVVIHLAVTWSARPTPPSVELPSYELERSDGITRFGGSWLRERGPLLEVGLVGTPEAIGYSHARLLYRQMVENEGILLGHLDREVPSVLLRHVLLDLAQVRYRNVDQGM